MLVVDGRFCRGGFWREVRRRTPCDGLGRSKVKKPKLECTFQQAGKYIVGSRRGYAVALYDFEKDDIDGVANDICRLHMQDGSQRRVLDVSLARGMAPAHMRGKESKPG